MRKGDHETDVSTAQAEKEEHARIPGAYGKKDWPEGVGATSCEGSLEAQREQRALGEATQARSARAGRVQSCLCQGPAD
jgi:hypothetical protein